MLQKHFAIQAIKISIEVEKLLRKKRTKKKKNTAEKASSKRGRDREANAQSDRSYLRLTDTELLDSAAKGLEL